MKLDGERESSNVEDRRGFSGGGLAIGGGVVGVIVLLLKFFLSGGDPSTLTQATTPAAPTHEMTAEEQKLDEQRAHFVKVVLADTEDVWGKLFADQGKQYQDPTLV